MQAIVTALVVKGITELIFAAIFVGKITERIESQTRAITRLDDRLYNLETKK